MKYYDISGLYHSGKANIVDFALSRLLMGSIAHVEDKKKELVHDAHRLAILNIRSVNLAKCSIMVQNHL